MSRPLFEDLFARYTDAVTRTDVDAIVGLYAPEAKIQIPVGGPVHDGIDAIDHFYRENELAESLRRRRDDGIADIVLAIGGPDGHGDAILDRADLRLAFGAATWPHQLVRVMLAEQIYRAVTILSGHPYHRA